MKAVLGVRTALPLAALVLTAAQLAGQTVSARAVIAAPKSSVRLGGVTDRVDGVWGGLAFDLHIGRFAVSGSGTRGQLGPAQAGTAPDQGVGEVSLGAAYDLRPWLAFGLRYTARAFSSAAGRQRWDIVVVGATATHDLGTPAVRAFARLEYLPLVEVSHQMTASFGLGSEVGISAAPGRIPLVVRLSYQVQRFRFPAATGRSEQFETLTLSAGARVRRLNGRWRLGG
jgi:hypothetical protein